MAACPVAIERGGWRNPLPTVAAFALGAVLFAYNLNNAVTIAGHRQDDRAAENRGVMLDAKTLQGQLTAAQGSRSAMPQFTPATEGAVRAAKKAADDATKNRADECNKRGPRCLDRTADERKANADLTDAENRKALTDQANRLDTKIDGLLAKLTGKGAAPKTEDATAERGGAFLASLGLPMGDKPAETYARWFPVFTALVIEGIALLGPVVLLALAYGRTVPAMPSPRRGWRVPSLRVRRPEPRTIELAAVETPPALPMIAEHPQSAPATPAAATPRGSAGVSKPKPSNNPATPATPTADLVAGVREWFETQTAARTGSRISAGAVFEAYARWAAASGRTPATQTMFGRTMVGELGAEKEIVNKRASYLGFSIKSTLALVASGE